MVDGCRPSPHSPVAHMIASKNPCSDVTRPAQLQLHSTTRLDTRLDTRPRATPELHSTTRLTPASSMLGCAAPVEEPRAQLTISISPLRAHCSAVRPQ